MNPLVFALFAGDDGQLARALVLVQSIRAFAGEFAAAPVEVYVPPGFALGRDALASHLRELGATVIEFGAPPEAAEWPYGAKVFAAAEAESKLAVTPEAPATILVWMDDDTVVLAPPREFLLPAKASLGWRPVMHTNVGSPRSEPLDAYWSAIYRALEVPPDAAFPMQTVADGAVLRPYFNAGCLAVRPRRGILRAWAAAMRRVTADSTLQAICAGDPRRRVFLHQAALSGAVLALLAPGEMKRLPDSVNYPLLFHTRYPAGVRFDSIEGRTTVRTEAALEAQPEAPMDGVTGPEATLRWLRERLGH